MLRLRWYWLVWAGWLVFIALQLVPLPTALLAEIAPKALELHSAAAALRNDELNFAPVSIAPGITASFLLQSLTFFVLFALVAMMVRSRARLRFLAVALVLSGTFQALYGTLLLLSGQQTGLFGDTVSHLQVTTGTFVNRNHLAGYLEITAAIGIGLVLTDLGQGGGINHWRGRFRYVTELLMSRTLLFRVLIAIMVIALILTRSRTGNIAFVTSLIVAASIYVLLRERQLIFKTLVVFATLILVDLIFLGNWFGLEAVVARIEETNAGTEARVRILPDLIAMAQAYAPTGSGLGTFYTSFPEYMSPFTGKVFYHAHNDYLQFVIEMGAATVFLGLLVLMTVWHCLLLLRKRNNRLVGCLAFSALMAMIAIGIHSAADFNLQIPANAATLVVLMAMVVSCPVERSRERSKAPQGTMKYDVTESVENSPARAEQARQQRAIQ